MRYYQEITLLTTPEVALPFLWSKVFQTLHLGLVEARQLAPNDAIGVSFPRYLAEGKRFGLGEKCRFFAHDAETLTHFAAQNRLANWADYVHCTGVRPVPKNLDGYAIYRRKRFKISPERLARRYASRHGMDEATAFQCDVKVSRQVGEAIIQHTFCYENMQIKPIYLPFIRLKSLSGGQSFSLWVEKTTVTEPTAGEFGSYGLSKGATVPEF